MLGQSGFGQDRSGRKPKRPKRETLIRDLDEIREQLERDSFIKLSIGQIQKDSETFR